MGNVLVLVLLNLTNPLKQGGGSYFPYILLNEIKTMFSQLAKQSLRKLSADTSTAHEQYDADGNAEVKKKWRSDVEGSLLFTRRLGLAIY